MGDLFVVLAVLNAIAVVAGIVWLLSSRRKNRPGGLCCVEGCRGTAAVFIWTDRGPAAFCSDCAELLADQARRRVPGH